MEKPLNNSRAYQDLLKNVVRSINEVRTKVALGLSSEQVKLYYLIGGMIIEKQLAQGWGKSVVEKLSADIEKRLGITEGFSSQNLWYMRQFFLEYKDDAEQLQMAGMIPWGQNILIISKVKDHKERKYYLQATANMGWSRSVLLNQIKANAYKNHKVTPKQHNFIKTLPGRLQEQANEILKSKYNLGFLGITEPIRERELEKRLVEKLKNFILELGYGFCYIGNQYKLSLKTKEYYTDLLFFHRSLRCLVAIDLKMEAFEPEYAGKMNFYLNLLDDTLKMKNENASIGIILCADKDSVEVDYALKGIGTPIAVAEYELKKNVPRKLQKQLPSPQELLAVIKAEMKTS